MDHSMEDSMNSVVIDSTEDLMDYSMDHNGTPEPREAPEDPVINRTVKTSTRLVIVDLPEVKDGKADFDINHLTLTASGKVIFIFHNVGIPRYFDDSVRWAVDGRAAAHSNSW
ncbi:hypothetical protein LTR12_000702 [Friedmanniomyces endolithicus]|nr:hypothetical protein LTR12_000702 [Friedmanniomyces endolithicus]